jgi:hypothetical protein
VLAAGDSANEQPRLGQPTESGASLQLVAIGSIGPQASYYEISYLQA